mmetsp:Transcript_9387/g.28526  ORF Transcript_9387/g.28526 Transcript_9387/m.28526 type:complete len:1245 (+) Transcript_9387:307-4041(+)|eukprot:scaffold201164_cov27-Tisochrysis_lutea.AAC.1
MPSIESLVNKLAPLHNFGPIKRTNLIEAFQTGDALLKATVEDIAKIDQISHRMATRIHEILNSDTPCPSTWAGGERVVVWNKRTRRKVSGAASPLRDNLHAWLENHKDYEVYTTQRRKQSTELHIPDSCKMTNDSYENYCSPQACAELVPEENLATKLKEYNLYPETIAVPDETIPNKVLCHVISHAASKAFGWRRDWLVASLWQKISSEPYSSYLSVLTMASHILKRKICVFTSLQEDAHVLEVRARGIGVYSQNMLPLRLAQHGNTFFSVSGEPLPTTVLANDLPMVPKEDNASWFTEQDVRHELKEALKAVAQLCAEAEALPNAQLDLATYKERISQYEDRLHSGDGEPIAFLGTNNVGKSTMINLCVLSTLMDEGAYSQSLDQTPEAVQQILSGTIDKDLVVPTLRDLLESPSPCIARKPQVKVILLPIKNPNMAKARFEKLKEDLRLHYEGRERPNMTKFLLPTGNESGTTTSLHTTVRFGKTFHALIEHASEIELQERAFRFVQLRHEVAKDKNFVDDIDDENDRLEIMEAWHIYHLVTGAKTELPTESTDLQNAGILPLSASGIELSNEMKEIVSSPSVLYLGRGEHLHLEREQLHDILLRLNDKDNLQRVAARSVQIFVPAAVLEGGCSLLDLPGLNDTNPSCITQTSEGLNQVRTVNVVLSKGLSADKATLDRLKELFTNVLKCRDTRALNVIFIKNRELDQHVKIGQVKIDDDASGHDKTVQLWQEAIKGINAKLRREGHASLDDDEIHKMASRVQSRSVFPMAHVAAMLHGTPQNDSVLNNSNFYWLLGSLEAVSRGGLMHELEQIFGVVLPQIGQKLQSSIDDSGAPLDSSRRLDGSRLHRLAKSWAQNRSSDHLESTIGSAVSDIERLLQVGSSTLTKEMSRAVQVFMDGDKTVTTFLDVTAAQQDKAWKALDERLKKCRFPTAVKVIDPLNKGVFNRYEILPVVFGRAGERLIDFQPLVEDLEDMLNLFKERVSSCILDLIRKQIQAEELDSPIIAELIEAFADEDLKPQMDDRFGPRFFSAKLTDPDLKNARVTDYFHKKEVCIRADALAEVLKKHTEVANVEAVRACIKDKLTSTRELWKVKVTKHFRDFVEMQVKRLYHDLTFQDSRPAKSRSRKSVVEKLLRTFAQNTLRTATVQKGGQLREQVKEIHEQLMKFNNTLQRLWAMSPDVDNAEELGRATVQYMHNYRQRAANDAAGVLVTLSQSSPAADEAGSSEDHAANPKRQRQR